MGPGHLTQFEIVDIEYDDGEYMADYEEIEVIDIVPPKITLFGGSKVCTLTA